jgi:hypothetical protein
VNLELRGNSANACPSFACNDGPLVFISCLLVAVDNALNGCAQPPATPPHPISR